MAVSDLVLFGEFLQFKFDALEYWVCQGEPNGMGILTTNG